MTNKKAKKQVKKSRKPKRKPDCSGALQSVRDQYIYDSKLPDAGTVQHGIVFDASELATVLAALRLFQNLYEGFSGDLLKETWPEHFADVEPLGTADIGSLCERINVVQPNPTHTPSSAIPEDEPIRFRNFYRCPNDDTEWQDEWSCECNDRCPVCDAEIEPYESEDLRTVECVCTECREINLLAEDEEVKTRACDDCGKVGTVMLISEDNKRAK